jgi:hypothetical protein
MTDDNWKLLMKPPLVLGNVMLGRFAFSSLTKDEIYDALHKHRAGDWGTVGPEEWHENDAALHNGGRVKSVYKGVEGTFWVITEWDRSLTRVLLPHEY